jgi:four helix bundle protein
LEFQKPDDLRERLFEFACAIVRVSQLLHSRGGLSAALSAQGRASAGANYEEADDGSSERDSVAKAMITLRELKETRFRLRVARKCDLLPRTCEPVVKESDELVRIVAAVIRKRRHEE